MTTIDENIAAWDFSESESFFNKRYNRTDEQIKRTEHILVVTYEGMVKDLTMEELRDEFESFAIDLETGIKVFAYAPNMMYETSWIDAWFAASILQRTELCLVI